MSRVDNKLVCSVKNMHRLEDHQPSSTEDSEAATTLVAMPTESYHVIIPAYHNRLRGYGPPPNYGTFVYLRSGGPTDANTPQMLTLDMPRSCCRCWRVQPVGAKSWYKCLPCAHGEYCLDCLENPPLRFCVRCRGPITGHSLIPGE
jgi:hypothetical protein